MKIRSRAIYQYLLNANVLNGTEEAIAEAKREYRKQYKRQWKQAKRPRKEIRIEFTIKEYGTIKLKATEYDQRPTTYARSVILSATEQQHHIVGRDTLLLILQLVSRAAIGTTKNMMTLREIAELLLQAETLLIRYLER